MNIFYTIDIIEKTEEELNKIFIIDQDTKNFYTSFKSKMIPLIKIIFFRENNFINNFTLLDFEKCLDIIIEESEHKNILDKLFDLICVTNYKTAINLYNNDIKIIYNYEEIKKHFNAINQQIYAKFTHPALIKMFHETGIDKLQIYDDYEQMHFKPDE